MVSLTQKEQEARKRICLPLDDLESLHELKERVRELADYVGLFKIGKGSFTRFGPESVGIVKDYGANVFLDLKYHDIPNTVRDAARAATDMGVYMFNVHASGGLEMMQAAVGGAEEVAFRKNIEVPLVVGVTVLTSLDKQKLNDELGIPGDVADQVKRLANLSYNANLDGIVCSAADLEVVRPTMSRNFMYVTPGIKGTTTPAGEDQKRVFSPRNAIRAGSDILVIGRAITGQKTPEERQKAAYEIIRDISVAL